MNFVKIADLWHTLMTERLGYVKYAAAGCDLGALITAQLGHKYADRLYGIHIGSDQKLSSFNGDRPWVLGKQFSLPWGTPVGVRTQIAALEGRFAAQLGTHILAPSTLSYGLNDSPVGMLAWLLEPWINWSDNGGDVESVFSKDDLLTHATIYWAGNSIGTAIRTYANNARYPWAPTHDRQSIIEAPTGITFAGHENPSNIGANKRMTHFLHGDLAHWYNCVNLAAHSSGGRFIPWEIPELWVDDLRRTFRGRV
jgi:microsomal epoxide hydrolase